MGRGLTPRGRCTAYGSVMTSDATTTEATGAPEGTAPRLAAAVGTGVFVALAPTAALAGRYLLVAAVIGAALATMIALVGTRIAVPAGRIGTIADAARLVGQLAVIAALAGCFGAYALPTRPWVAALGVLVFVTAADALRLRPPTALIRVGLLFVLVVLGVVVAACVAIAAPPPTGVPVPAGLPGSDDLAGIVPAAAVMLVAFAETGSGTSGGKFRGRWPVVPFAALACFLAVAGAVLYQLGPIRLALSPTPLPDVMFVAAGSAVNPLVTVGALAAVLLALMVLLPAARAAAHRAVGHRRTTTSATRSATALTTVPIGIAAAVLSWLLTPAAAIEFAAGSVIVGYALVALSAGLARRPGGNVRP
jgi:APA family basic amino acid/polyamine antiporter